MSENRWLLDISNSSGPMDKVLTLYHWISAQTHLIKGPHRVYFGLDFALAVQVNQLGYNTSEKLNLFIHISKMVATHSLVLVQELQGSDAELVPPGFSHSHEVLLLPSEQVCYT